MRLPSTSSPSPWLVFALTSLLVLSLHGSQSRPQDSENDDEEQSPDCPDLEIKQQGYNAASKPGDIILSEEDLPVENTTDACGLSSLINGEQYNWWQILLDMGGEPGTLKGQPSSEDASENIPSNPCIRPIELLSDEKYIYDYNDSDFKTYYRRETVYPRFQGTSKAFNDVRGTVIWTPPKSANDERVYKMSYVLDDTGFWVYVARESCNFEEESKTVTCPGLPTCSCDDGQMDCGVAFGLSTLALATLVG